MINKVLVPIDFSKSSKNATEAAISLARLYGAGIVYYFLETTHEVPNNLDGNIQEKVKQFELDIDTSGLEITKEFKQGNFINSIQKYISDNKIDLVVMGSHGISGINDLFIGSNTTKMIRLTSCPLIVVKSKAKDFTLNKVVFVSNFDNSNFGPFRTLIKLLLPFNTEINLLNIDTPGFFTDSNTIMQPALDAFKEYAEENGFVCKTYRKSDSLVERGIHNFIEEVNPDIVVIPTNDKSFLKRLFVASIAEAVVNHVDIPAMTIKV